LSTQWSNLFTPFNLILFVFFYHPRCIFQMHLLVSKLVFIIFLALEVETLMQKHVFWTRMMKPVVKMNNSILE
jgi:hypothetical protein